jgi:prohibitin 2
MGSLLFLLFVVSVLAGVGYSIWQSFVETEKANATKAKGTPDKTVVAYVPGAIGTGLGLIFFSLFLGAYSVDAGSVGVVKRFGRPVGTLQPGLHFVRPIGDTVTEVPVQTRVIKVSEQASSGDLQLVNMEVTLGYHVDTLHAMDILVQLNNDAETRVIQPAILESIKAEASQYNAQELITQRVKVRDGIENRVKLRLAPYYIVAESTSITNFSFSQQYEASIEAKQVAEQNAEKAKNDLNRIRVEADQAAAEAKGKADAAIAAATGEAQSTLIVAKAKAEGQRLQVGNITPELLQLRTIELMHDKWDGQWPTTFLGGSTPASVLFQPPATKAKQ